jgi:hypothetical protein
MTLTNTQNELIELLKLQWRKDDMVQHCFKSSEYMKIGNKFVDIADKSPSITKTLWFDDEQDIPDRNEEMFVASNMRLNAPKPMKLESLHGRTLHIITQYSGDRTEGKLCSLTYCDSTEYEEAQEVTEELLKEINAVRADLLTKYEKRLRSYYKKYSDKIYFAGYWVNR